MKIRAKDVKIINTVAWGMGARLCSVYITFTKRPVHKTREVLPEVFADFDKDGDIVGIEFNAPGDYDIDAMKQVSKEVGVPALEKIDISKTPITRELCTVK